MTCWEKLPHLPSCCPTGQSIPPLARLGRTLQRRSQERSQSNVFWFQSHTANMDKGSISHGKYGERITQRHLYTDSNQRGFKKKEEEEEEQEERKKQRGSTSVFTNISLTKLPLNPFRIERQEALTEVMVNPERPALCGPDIGAGPDHRALNIPGRTLLPSTATSRRALVRQFQNGGGGGGCVP